MTKKSRQISPQEWIQDYFCPAVSVLASADAEALCAKNNLTLTETLQPFSKLLSDVAVRDPEGGAAAHPVSGLAVAFQDFKKDPARLVNQRLLSDLVARSTEESVLTRTYGDACGREWTVEAPAFTPWFDLWMKLYIGSVPATEHEYSRHHVACVLATSSASQDPLQDLRSLVDKQHRHQQDKPNSYPQYMSHSVFKYYLLLHDAYETTDSRAQEVLAQMKSAFGPSSCHLLQINSRKVDDGAAEGTNQTSSSPPANPAMVDYWLGSGGHRFCNVDARREGVGATVITTAETASANAKSASTNAAPPTPAKQESSAASHPLDHPLALNEEDRADRTPSPPALQETTKSALAPVTEANVATHLTSNDIDRIRIFVRDFCTNGLLPYLEQQMRFLHEAVTNRKSRSLFLGAKRWFGQNKPGAASGTSVVYSKEATELQMRKLGDYYFMTRLFKQAYNCFHTCKKDFQSDEAWNYYAGAVEMAALSQFMQNDNSKKYPFHYMEDGITKYLQVCQMPEFAVRATLFDALCLKSMGLFQEAAARFMRMTNEQKDLRSSLLFEQAAYCHLLSTSPSPQVRKYAFHIILAGYRFSKAGQKEHAVRAYRQGFQIYRGRGWRVAEEHVLYTLGHQALLMKDYDSTAELFNELLSGSRPASANALQQMCHLREFFIVHHMREKGNDSGKAAASAAELTVPVFRAQQCVADLSCREWGGGEILGLEGAHPGASWQALEKAVCEQMRGQEILFLQRTCQTIFTPVSNNSLVPQAAVDEVIRIVLPVENKFHTALLLKKLQPLWKFRREGSEEWVDSESATMSKEEQAAIVNSAGVPSLSLEKNSTARVVLSLTPLVPGELLVTGVVYSMRAQFPQTVDTDYTIRGKQHFSVTGPRLKATKDHRTSVAYGEDHRLRFQVSAPRPRLELDLKMPAAMVQGEVRKLVLRVANKGKVAAEKLHLVHHNPGLFSVGGRRVSDGEDSLFDFPVIYDPQLRETREGGGGSGSGEASAVLPLDFLPLREGKLEGGAEEEVTLWVRAPEQVGRHEVKLLCYYRTAGATAESLRDKSGVLPERIFSCSHSLRVLPSATASASLAAAESFGNELGRLLTVHVSGVGKEGQTAAATQAQQQAGARDLGDIVVTRVGLVSHLRRISRLESPGQKSIQKSDSSAICLQVEDDTDAEADTGGGVDKAGGVNFTVVEWEEGKDDSSPTPPPLHQPPYLDFLKQGFFSAPDPTGGINSRSKNASVLRQDLVSVLWRAKQGSDLVRGCLVVPLRKSPSADGGGDDTDGGESTSSRSRRRDQAYHPPPPRPEVTVEVPATVEHDFRPSSSSGSGGGGGGLTCAVQCSIVATNPSSSRAVRLHLRPSASSEADDGCSLVGATRQDLILEPGETRRVEVGVLVAAPGLYQCSRLRVGTSSVPPTAEGGEEKNAGEEPPASRMLPVKISFFVRQKAPPSSSSSATANLQQ